MAFIKCPECKGEAGHWSSGDGWEEWDECRCCNPDGDNEQALTTPKRVAEFRAAEAAEDARIDAMIEEERRKGGY